MPTNLTTEGRGEQNTWNHTVRIEVNLPRSDAEGMGNDAKAALRTLKDEYDKLRKSLQGLADLSLKAPTQDVERLRLIEAAARVYVEANALDPDLALHYYALVAALADPRPERKDA